MNPFINLKRSSQYGGVEEYVVNVNHIVRIVKSVTGSQVFTLAGEFFCDENPSQITVMIKRAFDLIRGVSSDTQP
ncbi:hypothetical protein GO755_31980 [Spirosoma sp. HMF4905]|uniref:Uncharacterized protein n=1 Tax=Spirosoma arboris TaxID=2682092 RepID=A0A7K1SLK8_9BACT|nr:hypothetical protein [Spirosoma arboris]MVM34691.1 hypothetical protein [Spirosoma arboris]